MNGDERLRKAFRDLRDEDSRRVPPFSRVLRERRSEPGPTWLPLAAAAVLLAALALGAVLLPKLHRQQAPDPRQWAALTQWRAATDTLLDEPETPWGGPVRSTTDSLLRHSQLTSE